LARPEPIKVMMIIHDGAPFDPEVIEEWIRGHPQVFTVGVYLGDEPQEGLSMEELFGTHRLIACMPPELPWKMGQFVQGIVPRRH